MSGGLGRRIPSDFNHVAHWPLRPLLMAADHPYAFAPPNTEKSLGLPWWWAQADQGQEGSCVGWGCSHMMSVTNHRQRYLATGRSLTYRYDAPWLYHEAQLVDEWPDTPPAEGTSVKAGCDILRLRGHRRVQNGVSGPENLLSGISAVRWARGHDELRGAIYSDLAIAFGINWYNNFDNPVLKGTERWIGLGDLGGIRGGHCVCLLRMSDKRQAFLLMNSWGAEYPPVWIGYDIVDRLMLEDGEAACITDR